MNRRRASPRNGRSGRGTGCALTVIALVALLCFVAFVVGRVVAAPELGAAVSGNADGTTTKAISSHVAASVLGQFLRPGPLGEHAVVVVTERDLTVIARSSNPDPAKYQDPEVRIRDSYVVVSAAAKLGTLKVIAVARATLLLSGVAAGNARIATDIVSVDLGRQAIPDFMRSAIDPRGSAALSLDPIFNASPQLKPLRQSLECLYIGTDGIYLGFHRPGVAPVTTSCVPAGAGIP